MNAPPLLSTKFFSPSKTQTSVERTRWVRSIQSGIERRLTLISAPAGFGKSTLASQWAAQCGRRAAWVSLDPEDAQPARFLTYVVASLARTLAPRLQGVLSSIAANPNPSTTMTLNRLLVELEEIDTPTVLVLDDYHCVRNPEIDRAVEFLLDHAIPTLHLVVVTREDPGFAFARLRAMSQINEIRAQDLLFDRSEIAEFFRKSLSFELTDESRSILESRTEGWAAGLQLAALSLQDHPKPREFVRSFGASHRYVLDFLIEEVLNRQSPETIEFLVRSSVLDRFCASLCDAILEAPEGTSEAKIEEIERANLFLIALDEDRVWYRYHHLFAELLRQRNVEDSNELYRRASSWYEAGGDDVEAFRYARETGDFDLCARLAAGRGMPIVFRGAAAAYSTWLDAQDPARVEGSAHLWGWAASSCILAGEFEKAATLVDALERSYDRSAVSENHESRAHIASLRATIALSRHDAPTIEREARKALELARESNVSVQLSAQWTLAYALELKRDLRASRALYDEVHRKAGELGHGVMRMMSRSGLSFLSLYENDLESSESGFREVVALAGDPPSAVAGVAYSGLAEIALIRLELDTASTGIWKAQGLLEQLSGTDMRTYSIVNLARVELARGLPVDALRWIEQAERWAKAEKFRRLFEPIASTKCLVLTRLGKIDEAREAVQDYPSSIASARLDLETGNVARALETSKRIERDSTSPLWPRERVAIRWFSAVASLRSGDVKGAVAIATEVLVDAQRTGALLTLVEDAPSSRDLLVTLRDRAVRPEFVDAVLRRLDASGPIAVRETSEPGTPLSVRELEILELISQGLSNEQIGERLFVALSTIKGHNKNIFDKLEVQRRTEAVSVAIKKGYLKA